MKKVLYLSQIDEISEYIDRAVIDYINEGQIQTFESFPNFNIIAFDWYDIYDVSAEPAQIMIYLDKDDIFFLCEDEFSFNKSSFIFDAAGVSNADTNERTLYCFFKYLLKGDAKNLEAVEDKITETEDAILLNKSGKCAQTIVEFRREIRHLRNYYEQLDSIFEALTQDENGLISDDCLKYFVILGRRTDRLMASVVNLREYVTHVREAYQAQIDIEQNNLMKLFTVVTSIFLPLTLLVGWYGMNLQMPEFHWPLGYPMIIAASVVICIIWFIFFKKKKLL